MDIEVSRVAVDDIMPLRELYRREMHCQIIHDSFARRGFSDAYLLRTGGRTAGYGLVASRHEPDTVHEFYTVPGCRGAALPLFRELLAVSGATKIMAQTNDPLMLLMLHDCAAPGSVTADRVLFADAVLTCLPCPAGFRLRQATPAESEQVFQHSHHPTCDYLIEEETGGIVATGGALFHYNPPYADLFMEVKEPYRRRGLGSYLLQEIKRACYEMGKTPAARCNAVNVASRRTLQKAGLLPCGHVLVGDVAAKV